VLLLVGGFYLLGSVQFAVLWNRAFGLPDPRTYGSGNPGASNVLRSGSKAAAALTLSCDAMKGAAVLAPKALGAGEPALWGLLALAAVVGHAFPVFARLRGGKGVATAFGALLALDWVACAVGAATWIAAFAAVRISAVASLLGLASAGAFLALAGGGGFWLPAYLAIFALVAARHKDNVARLLGRSENRFS